MRLALACLLLLPAAASAQGRIVDEENVPSPPPGRIVDEENVPSPPTGRIVDEENVSPAASRIVDEENVVPAPASGRIVDDENAAPPTALPTPQPPAAGDGPALPPTVFRGELGSALSLDLAQEAGGEDTALWSSSLSMRVRHPLAARWSATLEGRLRWQVAAAPDDGAGVLGLGEASWQAEVEPRLGDLFVSGRAGPWLFRFGNAVASWGVSDFTRPADIVNPRDFRLGPVAGAEEATLSVPMLDATWVRGPAAWQFLVVPFFVPHRADVYGSDYAIAQPSSALGELIPLGLIGAVIDPSLDELVQPLLIQTERPDEVPANVSLGSRLVLSGAGLDVGVGYFWGWDRTPRVDVNPALVELLGAPNPGAFVGGSLFSPELLEGATGLLQGEPLLLSRYERRQTVTLDAVRYFGGVGVRAEAAFSPERTFYLESLESVRRAGLSAALGVGWESGTGEIVVGAEGFCDVALGGGDDAYLLGADRVWGVAVGADWDLGSVTASETSALGNLGLRAGAIVFPADNDAVLAPEVSWAFTESTTASAGAMVVLADDGNDGAATLYDGASHVFVRIRGAF